MQVYFFIDSYLIKSFWSYENEGREKMTSYLDARKIGMWALFEVTEDIAQTYEACLQLFAVPFLSHETSHEFNF